MAKRRPNWHAEQEPERTYDLFISHVAGDAEEVAQLKAEIGAISGRHCRKQLRCFLDTHDWLIGNRFSNVIRETLSQSEFMLLWITPKYLEESNRGWVWFELAYADLLEECLSSRTRHVTLSFVVPIFRNVTVEQVARTPLLPYWHRNLLRPGRDYAVAEIARAIVDFYNQEERRRGLLF